MSNPSRADEAPDEQLRLIGGGNDIFVTIGILLLMAGGVICADAVFRRSTKRDCGRIAAAVIWVIAEIVTRQQRMRLSSTVLAVIFMGVRGYFVWRGASTQIDLVRTGGQSALRYSACAAMPDGFRLRELARLLPSAAGYFWRFRVPVLAAVIALALTGFAFLQTGLFLYDGVIDGSVQVPTAEQMPDSSAQCALHAA